MSTFGRAGMQMLRYVLRLFGYITKTVLTVAIVVAMWVYDPATVNDLMDLNLGLIKYLGEQLPQPWGDQAETALRVLAGEKAFLFLEVNLVLQAVWLFFRLCLWISNRRVRAVAAIG